jgi:capsular exopolysaccharide synthesis family protein
MAQVPESGPSDPGPSYVPGSYGPSGYYAGDPYGGRAEVGSFDWRQYLMVLRRRMWPALTVFVIASVAGIVHGFTRIPVYDAKVRILIDRDRPNITGLSDPLAQSGIAADYTDVQTQTTLLQSPTLAKKTTELLGLAAQSDPSQTAPPPSAANLAIAAGSGPLRVVPVAGSRLIDVFYRSPDPTFAAKYANTLTEEFVKENLDTKSATSKDLTEWLKSRMDEQRKAVDESDRRLQDYANSHNMATGKEESGLLVQKLSGLTADYTKAKTDRITKEAVFTQLESIKRGQGTLEEFQPILQIPTVQALRVELNNAQRNLAENVRLYGDRNPKLQEAKNAVQSAQARFQAEVNAAAETLRREYAQAQETERKLGVALEQQKQETMASGKTDVTLAMLQRDSESNKQIYQSLIQRENEFAVTREGRAQNIRIIDPADIPQSPTGDAAKSDMRYGLVGGLILALIVAFGLERADNCVKTPQQLKELGLVILGLVPRVATDDLGGPLLSRETPPAFNEAFRGIRTNVRLSIAVEGMRSLVVTSPRPGDGKTAVASNLAVALALSDQRVLLIDADMRRPRLHKVFDVPQAPGLSDLLVGQSTASVAVRRMEVPNLHLLTCGATPPNPSELLESRRFTKFLAQLHSHFDWVVIDAPPILPVTDASILCGKVNGVLFVASAEKTPLPALRGALEQLARTQAHILGVVLNLVDVKRRGYYYTEYYNRDTEKYYTKSAV